MKLESLVMQVRPNLLFNPYATVSYSSLDPNVMCELLDRVVNIRPGCCVPLGLRGTIIGIKSPPRVIDVLYEILFDESFSGALPMRGATKRTQVDESTRIYYMSSSWLLNLTRGRKSATEVKIFLCF